MLHRVFLPQLGQTMEEGTVERWHKAEGDEVRKGEVLYELTTDKATLEVEAFAAGVLKKILVEEGRTVPVNELIAVIGAPEDELPEDLCELAAGPRASAGAEATTGAEASAATAPQEAPVGQRTAAPSRSFASPRARKAAEELKVPLAAVAASGPDGRVIERDVLGFADRMRGVRHTPTAAVLACREGVSLPDLAGEVEGRVTRQDVIGAVAAGRGRPAAARRGEGERVELSPMRQTIAERMTASKQSAPHFYLIGDVRMGEAMAMLARLKEEGTRVTVTGLLVKAVGLALKEHPRVNARFAGEALLRNTACNVGVAVAVEDGLFVPVIRDADAQALPVISAELKSLAETAREGKLIPEQYEGGCITISNLGMYGVGAFLPIINPPESVIIGVGAIAEQPVARDGGIAVEAVMKLSLSADHRVVDGAEAAAFFQTLKGLLEEPEGIPG